MSVNYNKLWKMLIDKNMKKQDLQKMTGLSKGTVTKLGKNENVSTHTLSKICSALNCDMGDIAEFEIEILEDNSDEK